MATTRKRTKLLPPEDRGKPFPPFSTAQHGTRTMYLYGCRCDPCRQAEANYHRQWRKARKADLAAQPNTTEEAP